MQQKPTVQREKITDTLLEEDFVFVKKDVRGLKSVVIRVSNFFQSIHTYLSAFFTPILTHVTKSSTDTVDVSTFVHAFANSADITLTIPTASGNAGGRIIIKKEDSTSNHVIVEVASSGSIDGNLQTIIQYEGSAMVVESDGTKWYKR